MFASVILINIYGTVTINTWHNVHCPMWHLTTNRILCSRACVSERDSFLLQIHHICLVIYFVCVRPTLNFWTYTFLSLKYNLNQWTNSTFLRDPIAIHKNVYASMAFIINLWYFCWGFNNSHGSNQSRQGSITEPIQLFTRYSSLSYMLQHHIFFA